MGEYDVAQQYYAITFSIHYRIQDTIASVTYSGLPCRIKYISHDTFDGLSVHLNRAHFEHCQLQLPGIFGNEFCVVIPDRAIYVDLQDSILPRLAEELIGDLMCSVEDQGDVWYDSMYFIQPIGRQHSAI